MSTPDDMRPAPAGAPTRSLIAPSTISAFRKSLLSQQRGTNKTTGGRTRAAIGSLLTAIVGAGAIAACTWFNVGLASENATASERERAASNGFITVTTLGSAVLGLIVIIAFISFLVMLPRLLAPRKAVQCTTCHKTSKIFRSVRFYSCPTCLTPWYMDKSKAALVEARCPSCERQFGIVPKYGQIRCGNCGVRLNMANGALTAESEKSACPTCGTVYEQDRYACPSCGTLNTRADASLVDKSLDAMLARDRYGLTLHVRGRLAAIEKNIEPRRLGDESAAYYANTIGDLVSIMDLMLQSEVLEEPVDLATTSSIARQIDQAYARCLLGTYKYVRRSPTERYNQVLLTTFFTAPQAAKRLQVQTALEKARVRQGAPTLDMGVSDWHRELVRFENVAWSNNDKHPYRFKDPTPLKVEALRIEPDLSSAAV